MYNFDYERPSSIEEAKQALSQADASAISGGQTLIPTLKQRLAAPSVLVSLAGIDEMRGITEEGGRIRIGGGTTHGECAEGLQGKHVGLAYLASKIGDPAVRARGTIGGSLANDDPSACWPAGILAANGTIHTDARDIPVDEFFQGMFTTALDEGEIVTAVSVPSCKHSAYAKMIQPASRFPLTASFVCKTEGRVAITGAGDDGVFRWAEAEEALASDFSEGAIEALDPPSNGMISDLHGSADYRRHLCKVMTKRAVRCVQSGEPGMSSAG